MIDHFKKIRKQREGFTLIELIISIVIFVVFLGIVSQSYIAIVRAQREANEVRKMYSDVRLVMDFIAEEVRLSALDYDCYAQAGAGCDAALVGSLIQGRTDHLALIRQGATQKTFMKLDDAGRFVVRKLVRQGDEFSPAPGYEVGYLPLTSDRITFETLSFAIFPDVNPYSSDITIYRDNGTQFQPKVTLFMSVRNAEHIQYDFDFDFQTSISSRVYSRAT